MSHTIVVTGATGKQGSAVLQALVDHQSSSPKDLTIYAVTRNPDSSTARALKAKSKDVRLLNGDLALPAELVHAIPKVANSSWSTYILSNPGKREVAEAIGLIDEAIKAGVQHIVYSSVDRGLENGGNCPSPVQHWQSKHEIEAHLRAAAAASKQAVTYTILRPVFLLDNLSIPGFGGKLSGTLWKEFVPRPVKVVDPYDIGAVAAKALLDTTSRMYRHNTEMSLCGDELTFEQADKIFRAKVGRPIPTTSRWLVSLVLFAARDFGRMVDVLATKGFGATVGAPEAGVKMSDFGTWVERSRSKFVEDRSA